MKIRAIFGLLIVSATAACAVSQVPATTDSVVGNATQKSLSSLRAPEDGIPPVNMAQHTETLATDKVTVEQAVRTRLSTSSIQSLEPKLTTAGALSSTYRTDVHSLTDNSPVWFVTVKGKIYGFSERVGADGTVSNEVGSQMNLVVSAHDGHIISATLLAPTLEPVSK